MKYETVMNCETIINYETAINSVMLTQVFNMNITVSNSCLKIHMLYTCCHHTAFYCTIPSSRIQGISWFLYALNMLN